MVMSAVLRKHRRYHILSVVVPCQCVLPGEPSYAAGAENLFIGIVTYYGLGVAGLD